MSNPLLVFWRQMFGRSEPAKRMRYAPIASAAQASVTIFLVMRRMRAPLITLILIFTVSVFGLTLMPGIDPQGRPWRMSIFDAFYFMSYTATTIGFGELPYTFSAAQRLWVTGTIYVTVIGWAYAIGSLLALLQDRGFRQALALQRFQRKVARLRTPFLLFVGFGRTGELLGRSLDDLGQQFVVLDGNPDRIDHLELLPLHGDVPGLVGDAENPHHLGIAGLDHPYCAGVLALTNSDEANLSVAMSAALIRPELPVIARTLSRAIGHRMEAFGTPSIINPFDRFGDHLRLALRAPASYQLLNWLESGPGGMIPERGHPPTAGRWVVCGYGRFGKELTADLRAEGLEVSVIEPTKLAGHDEPEMIVEDASAPGVLARAKLGEAVGFVAGTDNDTTNLSLVAAARRLKPGIFVAARQNRPTSAPLFAALHVDALLVPTEVVAHEVYAQLSTPLLWRFLQEMPSKGDAWAAELVDRLTEHCGHRLEGLWKVQLTATDAPALTHRLRAGEVCLGGLLRDPEARDVRLHAVPLLVRRHADCVLMPDDDYVLAVGDELLFAGRPAARRALSTIMIDISAMEYVLNDRHVPSSWIWRKLSRSTS